MSLQMFTSYPSSYPSTSTTNFFGPSSTTSSVAAQQPAVPTQVSLPPLPTCNSNLLTTNTSSYIGLNRMSPLPMRRYSYSGALPSSNSMSDNMHLVTNDSSITNLINATCQSISRSSNILNRQLSVDMALACMSLTNLLDENIESDIVKYDLLNEITTTAPITPSKYSHNFYSQPAIMQQRYTPYFPQRQLPTLPILSTDDYLLSKPIFSKDYLMSTSSYINDDNYNNYNTSIHPHSYTTATTTHPLHYHHHYASNPCLSSYHSYHNSPHHHSYNTNNIATPYSLSNRNYHNYQSHHQQPFSSSRPPSISSLNRYNTTSTVPLSNNYSSFNAQPYYRTSSRIDLDNPKSSEIKRQVSFKFDVDQMSFDP